MSQQVQSFRPLSMNMDVSLKYLKETEAFYISNQDRYLTLNASKKGTLGKTPPAAANRQACDMDQPVGENYAVGKHYAAETKELYSWVFNSNGVNWIQRINSNGDCEVVWYGSSECMDLSAEPQHSIEQFRAFMKVDKVCANRDGKALIWVNGKSDIGMIDTEASIATNNFTTPFFQRCADPCAPLRMCVPDPCGCLRGEFVPLDPSEAGLTNNLLDVGIKLSYRHIYYDGRASIWAEPSTLFFQDKKGCFDNTESLPRCIRIRVPIGNPLVDKIEIAFTKDGVNWATTEVIDKYKKYNNTQQKWYERDLAELNNYSDEDCAFDYYFCNDKKCDPIATEEFNRVFNPIPRSPQTLMPIQDSLAFLNYISGNCPIDQVQVEKFKVSTSCDDSESCDTQFATVKAYAIIHNRTHNRNQFIYRLGGDATNAPDDLSDIAYFGGLNDAIDGGFEIGFDQQFREETRNFICYVEATEYWDEGKQFKADAFFTNKQEWGTIADMDSASTRNRWRRAARNGEFFYQQFEIKVPKGTRGFLRLASHQATGNEPDTSTFVVGILDGITQYKGDDTNVDDYTDFSIEEIYFDTCNGDVELQQAFRIADNASDEGGENKASAYYGYIRDKNNKPIEGAKLFVGVLEVSTTDHNGFYHFFLQPGDSDPIDVDIRVEQDCFNFTTIKTMSVQSAIGFNTQHDETIDNDAYANGFYATVQMRVEDCDGLGVPGVRVAISGSKYGVTDASGTANIRIRNYENRDRNVRTVVMNVLGCISKDCGGNCAPCMPTSVSNTFPCYLNKPTVIMTKGVINKTSAVENRVGLKSGGRYPMAIVVKFGCGKISAAYDIGYLDIPKVQQRNKEGFCMLTFDAEGMELPEDALCVDILRGENVNPFELQWLVDKIERTVDGKIKLTIQSLNDYNEKYLFKTNTIYQWLANDRVEFIKNGDGKIFSIGANGLLNYQTISPFNDEQVSGNEDAPADFFNQLLIDDDGRLSSLTEGAVIEIQRPKVCDTEPAYFGICASIPVLNGRLVVEKGQFNSFDTYYVNRVIGNFPSQRFEHHSPSDFWGTRLTDAGRAYFANKFENERRFGRNISINSPNEYNYFGDRVKVLNPSSHGDIIAAFIVDDKIGVCISETDNSLFEVGDDLLRVGQDGIVRALTADSIISDAQAKISGTYGCRYQWIGGIEFGDGWITWFDVSKGTYVRHDYNQAKPVDEGRCQTHFRRRAQEIEYHNANTDDPLDKYRLVTGKNWHNGEVHLTIKKLRDNAINNQKSPFLQPNDTIRYHPIADDFPGYIGYTPEAYGRLELSDERGCAFVTFIGGIPWVHPVIPEEYNKFYGITVDRVIGLAINQFPEKEKIAIGMEIQDQTMWFVSDVFTDKPNYKSEIPPIKMGKDKLKWNGSFLGNINSRRGLYGDERPAGEYIAVTLVRDNTDGLKYGAINPEKRVIYSELDAIFFKFSLSEQTGFQNNV